MDANGDGEVDRSEYSVSIVRVHPNVSAAQASTMFDATSQATTQLHRTQVSDLPPQGKDTIYFFDLLQALYPSFSKKYLEKRYLKVNPTEMCCPCRTVLWYSLRRAA